MTNDDATDPTGTADDHPGQRPFDDVDPADVELSIPDAFAPTSMGDAALSFGDDELSSGGGRDDQDDDQDDGSDTGDADDSDDDLADDDRVRLDLDPDDPNGDDDGVPGPRQSQIDLSVDDSPDDSPDDSTDDVATDPTLDDAELAGVAVGVVGTMPLADWAADALPAGITHDDVVAVVERLGLDPVDLGPREVAHVLERLGADAWVDHGSVDSLAELLSRGGRCQLVDGSDRFDIVAVDDRTDELVVRDTASGTVVNIALDAFEDAWSASAFAQLTPAGDDPVVLIAAHVTTTVPVTREDDAR